MLCPPANLCDASLQGLQAEVFVREEHPYQGTASYFRNVQRQHAPRPVIRPPGASGGGGGGGGSTQQHQRQQQQQLLQAASAAGPGSSGPSEGWTLVEDGSAGSGSEAAGVAGEASLPPTSPSPRAPLRVSSDEETAGQAVAVTCINLLHANPKKASELMLSSHFQDVRAWVGPRRRGARKGQKRGLDRRTWTCTWCM